MKTEFFNPVGDKSDTNATYPRRRILKTIQCKDSYLSNLDETMLFGEKLTLLSAKNALLKLRSENGKVFTAFDLMSSYGAVNFGHNNPKINPYKREQSDIVASCYPEEAELFASWLCRKLQSNEHKVLFQIGGSFAVSTALAIALKYRKGKIMTLEGAFHGLGIDSLGVTQVQKEMALQSTELVRNFEKGISIMKKGEIPSTWDDISCLIFEPIQGASGYIPLDKGWIKKLVIDAQQNGVSVISDEIQAGYYRHGYFSPSLSMKIPPDIWLFGKSMTNGQYPFSAVVYHKKFETNLGSGLKLAHTFQTSVIGCRAAYQVAQFLEEFPINKVCKEIEKRLRNVSSYLRKSEKVTNIYLTGPTLSFEITGNRSKVFVKSCLKRGVFLLIGGANSERVRMAPPLTISEKDLDFALDIIKNEIEIIEKL